MADEAEGKTSIFARKDGEDESEPATKGDLAEAKAEAEEQTDLSKAREQGADALAAAEAQEQNQDGESVVFSSHPIRRLRIGRFQFDDATLTLSPADAKVFEKLLATASPQTQNRVQKIDVASAAKLAAGFASRRVRGVDTSRPGPSGNSA